MMDTHTKLAYCEGRVRSLRLKLAYVPPDLIEQEVLVLASAIMNLLDPEGKCVSAATSSSIPGDAQPLPDHVMSDEFDAEIAAKAVSEHPGQPVGAIKQYRREYDEKHGSYPGLLNSKRACVRAGMVIW